MTKSTETSALPPRPLNCFLLYRIDKQKEIVAKCEGANHRDISKIIAKWWKEATDEEKLPYVKKAQEEKKKHAKIYPDYKYSPKKKTAPKRIYKRRTNSTFTSRNEENNRMMELIYDDSTSLKMLDKEPKDRKSCLKIAISDKDLAADIKIEEVESLKPVYTVPSDSPSPFTDDSSSCSATSPTSSSCFSPEPSWKGLPYSKHYTMTPDIESPRLSFSTRLPLQAFSPVSCYLSPPNTQSTTGFSTPSIAFSPTSYGNESFGFYCDDQQQIYNSSFWDNLSTPTDLTPNAKYFADFDPSADFTAINVQDSNDFAFIPPSQWSDSLGLAPKFEYSHFQSDCSPPCIDPSFIMKY